MTGEANQTPTPSPTATESAPASPAGGDEPGFDFGALATHDSDADDSGASESPSTVAATPPPPASPPASPQAEVPGGPPAVPVVAPAPSAAPSAPPEQVVAQQPPASGQPPATVEAQAPPELSIEQHREKFLPQLQNLYKLDDAAVEELRTNPETALPKLAARLHYEVQMGVYQGILSVLPQVIGGQMKSYETHAGHEKAFFDKWPALKEAVSKNPETSRVIVGAIQSYMQFNPKASVEERIAQAGLLAMMHLKLPINMGPQAPANGAGGLPAPVVQPPSLALAPARPPGVGTTGHVPMAPASGTGGEEDLIGDLIGAHERGEV